MKKSLKWLASLILVIALVASLFTFTTSAASGEPTKYSKEYNSGERGVVCTTLSGTSAASYYTGNYTYENLSDMSSSSLKSNLSTLMKSTHKNISSYDDCHYKANRTDCENENGSSKKLSLIYTSYTATMSQWNGWNREHVWPKSLGGDTTSGGGADLHHIRPSDAVVNSTRGNKKYGYANGGKQVYGSNPASGYLGGSYGTYFEPLDEVKGDVARICLYVYVRWGSDWGATSITKVFQSVDVLLEWCEMDPVDTWEMGRNEVVQDIQGNRNVFIDYPEYAWILFDKEVPDDMQTPSGMAKQGNSGSGNEGGNDPSDTCEHISFTLINKVVSCTSAGYTGDKKCNTCGTVFEKGTTTTPTGKHTVGTIIRDNDTEKVYTCSVCNLQITEKKNPSGDGGSGNEGGSSGVCTHESYTLIGEIKSCVDMGYSGDKKCNDCDEVFETGLPTIPTGQHTVGTIISEDDAEIFYICSECGEGVFELKSSAQDSATEQSWIVTAFNAVVGWFKSVFQWIGNLFKK